MTDTDPFSYYEELNRTFRFYIALTVFANIAYGVLVAVFAAVMALVGEPLAVFLLLIPAMVSTGFAALSGFGVREAISLHRAIQATGADLGLPHVTQSVMLPVQTTLTLIFHALFALGFYAAMFFAGLDLMAR